MTLSIIIIALVFLLKWFSSLGDVAFTISQIGSIILGLWLSFSIIIDLFANIPKTISSKVHPNRDPEAEDPGEIYKELWAQQKRKYVVIIFISILFRGIIIILILNWFLL